MSVLSKDKSFNNKRPKPKEFLSPQLPRRTTLQYSNNFLKELESNQKFLNQREKIGNADKRKSMSLGDLPIKEMGFFEKLTSKLSKSKSMSVKNVEQHITQRYRHKQQEIEQYQREKLEDQKPSTPKFPVPEVQLRKPLDTFKPIRGNSRSNTIHIVHTPAKIERDILISGPLKLQWLNSGKMETIDKGCVIYRNDVLTIKYDDNQKTQMNVSSTTKTVKLLEFSNSEECVKVSVDKQSQITTGSPIQRRKSVDNDSPKNSNNKQNILMKLLRRRSDKVILEKKGIFKNEDIFGNKLAVVCETSKSAIPEFVKRAVELIELEKNIKSEHIYRLSGNMATIQKIRLKIDGKNYKVLEDYKSDVDVLTGCLKLFYRELVEPLIPYKTFEELNKLLRKPVGPDRDKSVKSVIKSMKTPHRENLLYLVKHLLTVESYKQHNKMTVQSLSIVWGPSMLWYPGAEKCTNYAPYEFSMLVNSVVELVLMSYQDEMKSDFQSLAKNDSERVSWKELETIDEEQPKKSPSAAGTSRWLFGLRKATSRDDLTASNWSLTETKKDKVKNDGHLGYLGKSLESLPKSELYPSVPKIIIQMTEVIEKNSEINGLYLKTTNKDAWGKFKKKMQKNKLEISKMDPLDVAIVLPKFLQELETRLVPKHVFEDFVENFDKTDDKQKMMAVKINIADESKEKQDTLEHLANHLLKILDHYDTSAKESIKNLWLPVFTNTTKITVYTTKFVKTILDIYDERRNPTKVPRSSWPLKKDFEHKFNFKNTAEGVLRSYVKKGNDSNRDSSNRTSYFRSSSALEPQIKHDIEKTEISTLSNVVDNEMIKDEDDVIANNNNVDLSVSPSKPSLDKLISTRNYSPIGMTSDITPKTSSPNIDNPNVKNNNVDNTRNDTKEPAQTVNNKLSDNFKSSLSKFVSGNTLENIRARAEMSTFRKT